jgi:hypothetical protein
MTQSWVLHYLCGGCGETNQAAHNANAESIGKEAKKLGQNLEKKGLK